MPRAAEPHGHSAGSISWARQVEPLLRPELDRAYACHIGSQGRGFHSARVFRASPAMEEHLTRSSQRTNASRGPLQSRGVRETLQSLDPGGITGQEFGPWVGFLPLLPEITNIGAGKFFDQHALCWPAGERVCQALAGVAGSGFGASGEGCCCQVWCCRKTWEVFQVSLRSRT